MLDKISLEFIDEIISIKSDIISITGNTDPTYAGCEFGYFLINFENKLIQIGIRECEYSNKFTNKFEWMMEVINMIDSEYQIRKRGDKYFIDRLNDSDIVNENFGLDYGGIIMVYNI